MLAQTVKYVLLNSVDLLRPRAQICQQAKGRPSQRSGGPRDLLQDNSSTGNSERRACFPEQAALVRKTPADLDRLWYVETLDFKSITKELHSQAEHAG